MPQNNNELNPKTLILHIEWGGLGDNLFYSHLPRIAKTIGISHSADSMGGGELAHDTISAIRIILPTIIAIQIA